MRFSYKMTCVWNCMNYFNTPQLGQSLRISLPWNVLGCLGNTEGRPRTMPSNPRSLGFIVGLMTQNLIVSTVLLLLNTRALRKKKAWCCYEKSIDMWTWWLTTPEFAGCILWNKMSCSINSGLWHVLSHWTVKFC